MPPTINLNRKVGDILADIRANSPTERAKGDNFERLFCKTAKHIPELEIADIWRWADWPELAKHDFDGRDDGVDLVAQLTNGDLVAVQCKCYAEDRKIGKEDIQKFIAGAKPQVFNLRWFVATTDYSDIAARSIKDNDIRVIDFREYLKVDLGAPSRLPQRALRPLQQEAIDDVMRGYESGQDRGRLIMACGTGKTFTALRLAEKLVPNNSSVLFIAPSIALVAQARREWLQHTARPLACTVVCSDQTAGRRVEDIGVNEISCQVTTTPQSIAQSIKKPIAKGGIHAVFCTYQSLDKVRDAQHQYDAPPFALALIDEAHRTTGYIDESGNTGLFQLIHQNDQVRADKRLYMTATPRIYDLGKNQDLAAQIIDMNNSDNYGNEFYRLSFKKAVEADMLCDYRVVALGITEGALGGDFTRALVELNDEIGGVGKAADEQAFLALGAIGLAINGIIEGRNQPGVLARTIAYASNIRRSKWLAQALRGEQMKKWIKDSGHRFRDIQTQHLDGTSSALKRNQELRKLNDDATEETPCLISNAQLFTEGVDVPALNAIAFLDPRQSKVDTIQAVGRVMRRSPGKALGYIVVPVILPPNKELLDTLNEDKSRFKSLGAVLRALQSHDERLYTELSDRLTFATIEKKYERNENAPVEDYQPSVQLSLLDEDAKQAIYAQIAKNTGISARGKIIADAITQAIDRAASIFEQENTTPIIANTIGTPTDNPKESCKMAALLIANACIMHKRLEETGNLRGLMRIEKANITPNPSSALAAVWATILEKDYAPVFQDAVALLVALSEKKGIERAIATLIQCAIDNATTLNELGFDHAGPLYHKVLGTAQSDGAFYTKNLSAYLLAGLAFDENFTAWGDPEKVNSLRIVDPACGTGTLLMAALNVIKKRAVKAQNLTDEGRQALHKHLVENCIFGFDINRYSVQLAACNLTIGAPNTDYERINLHTLEHGPVKGANGELLHNVRHGALEMLLGKEMGNMIIDPPVMGKSIGHETDKLAIPSKFQAVIYNPPFTDTSKQGRKYAENVTRAMTSRLQSIKSDLEKHEPDIAASIGKGSIQPYFTPLARNLLSDGKLAKIIPATVCTSENARAQRQYLAANYHIETVVTSHDPRHVNFSENTSIHECLVIGKRKENNSLPTRFIQLAQYPADLKAAEKLIDAIQSGEKNGLYGETLWQADKMRAGNWSPVQWFNPKLVEVADKFNMLPRSIVAKSTCALGYGGPQFRTDFNYIPNQTEGGMADSFCTINEDIIQTIQAKPETKAIIKPNNQHKVAAIWQKASRLLVATRFSTTSSRLLAIYSEQPAIGSAWYAIKVDSPKEEKAFAAFLNSSFGVIQMLNRRTRKLTYPQYEVGHLNTVMLPDPSKANLAPLLAAFEEVKDIPLGRLSACANDAARKILDYAAAEAIGIDPAITDQWREWLSQEPTITNKPYQAWPPKK